MKKKLRDIENKRKREQRRELQEYQERYAKRNVYPDPESDVYFKRT